MRTFPAEAPARSRTAAVATIIVSDVTSLPAVGLNGRQFRAFVREHNIPHVRVGRRLLARVDRVLEVVDRLSGGDAAAPRPEWNEDAAVQAAAKATP